MTNTFSLIYTKFD